MKENIKIYSIVNVFSIFLFSLLVFLFIFPFTIFSMSTQFLVLTVSLLSIFRKVEKWIVIYFICFLIYIFSVFIYFGEVSYLLVLFLKVLTSYFFAKLLIFYIPDIRLVFRIIIYACLIHALIILFQVLLPEFKSLWFSFVVDQSKELFTIEERLFSPFRNFGVSGFLFADQSVIFSFAFCLLILSREKFNGICYFSFLILLIACAMMSGRSGLFLIFSFLMLIFFMSNIFSKIKIFISTLLLVFTTSAILLTLNPEMFDWAFEPFINLFHGKDLSESSSDTFSRHFYWLNTFNENIFGMGIFTLNRQEYLDIGYHPSDSIYMRFLVSGGLVQLAFFILIYFHFTFKSIVNLQFLESKYLFFLILFYVFVLFFSLKSFFIFSNFVWLVIFVCCFVKKESLTRE